MSPDLLRSGVMLNGIYPFCTRFYNGASCYGMHGWLKAVLKFNVQQGALKPEESEKQARNLGAEVSKIG